MLDLLAAIQTKFNASPALADTFPYGCYLSKAPKDSPLPNCVLTVIPGRTDYQTGDEVGINDYVEHIDVQFSVRADSDTVALGSVQDVCDQFDRAHLPMTTDRVMDCRRTTSLNILREDSTIWHAFVSYRITVERSV
jgi:hypothetical protein